LREEARFEREESERDGESRGRGRGTKVWDRYWWPKPLGVKITGINGLTPVQLGERNLGAARAKVEVLKDEALGGLEMSRGGRYACTGKEPVVLRPNEGCCAMCRKTAGRFVTFRGRKREMVDDRRENSEGFGEPSEELSAHERNTGSGTGVGSGTFNFNHRIRSGTAWPTPGLGTYYDAFGLSRNRAQLNHNGLPTFVSEFVTYYAVVL
jgi:hypothetical protein